MSDKESGSISNLFIPIHRVSHMWENRDDECYSNKCSCCGVCDCFGADYEYLVDGEFKNVECIETYVCIKCIKCLPKTINESEYKKSLICLENIGDIVCSRCQVAYVGVDGSPVNCSNQDYLDALNFNRDELFKKQQDCSSI